MRVRPLVLCVVLIGAALGAVGCSSSGTPAAGATSRPAPLGTPTGTVTVRSGGKVVCVITLGKNGSGKCTVSTKGDAPGQVTYTGSYSGDKQFKPVSGSATVTLLPPPKPAGPVAPSTGSATT